MRGGELFRWFTMAGTTLLASACGPDHEAPPLPGASAARVVSPGRAALEMVRARMPRSDHAAPGGAPHQGASVARVSLPSVASGAAVLEEPSGLGVSVRLTGAEPTPVADIDGYGVFVEAFRGGTLIQQKRPDGFEDYFVVDDDAVTDFEYEITLRGVKGLRLVARMLELLDGSGTPRLRMLRPYLVDSADRRRDVTFSVEGCAFDADPRAPWGRSPVAPRSDTCRVRLTVDARGLEFPIVVDPGWTVATSPPKATRQHSATLLPNGTVLVSGGQDSWNADLSSVLYDPSTDTWAATGVAIQALGTAVLLPTGEVFKVTGDTQPPGAQRYDPSTGAWAAAPPPTSEVGGAVVQLSTGDVMLARTAPLVFQYQTNTWTPAPSTPGLKGSGATRLSDGRILLVGGAFVGEMSNTAWLYDPVATTWSPAAPMLAPRNTPQMITIADGRAIVGPSGWSSWYTDATQAMELYDPSSNTWSAIPPEPLWGWGEGFRPIQLFTGKVLFTMNSTLGSKARLYDPVTNTVEPLPDPINVWCWHTATRLLDGRVLLALGSHGLFTGTGYNQVALWSSGADGGDCTVDGECTSGHCVDGACCATACDAPCHACSATKKGGGVDGACGPIGAGMDPDAECADDGSPVCQQNGFCDGAGACQTYPLPNGCVPEGCTVDSDCTSNHCVDGICCDTPCSELCYACSAAKKGNGIDGLCGPIAAGLAPDDDCAQDPVVTCHQNGTCDGVGQCALYPSLTPCGANICLNGVLEFALCNGTGTCLGDNAPCTPYAKCADASSCASSCTSDTDCVVGYVCIGSVCTNGGSSSSSTTGTGGQGRETGAGGGGSAAEGGKGGAAQGATSASTGTGMACVPGQQVSCACAGGGEGVQLCKQDGDGFGPCEGCSPDPVGSSGDGSSDGANEADGGCSLRGRAPANAWWLGSALALLSLLRTRSKRTSRSPRARVLAQETI